jgi:hypothetical protein
MMKGLMCVITGIFFSGCTSFGHLEKFSTAKRPAVSEALSGIYTCMDSAWQKACSNSTSCTFLSRPFLFSPDGTVVGIGHIGFRQPEELTRYLAVNRQEIYNHYQMLGSYRRQGDTIIVRINYPYYGKGQQGIYRPTTFSGMAGHGDTIKSFKMIPPWPDIYTDAFYQEMNGHFSRLLRGTDLLYKGRLPADSSGLHP